MQQENQQRSIAALWPIAKAAANYVKHNHKWPHADHKLFGPQGNGGGWDGSDYIAAAFAEPGVIEYRLRGGADVRIIGIDVDGVDPKDVYVGPIEPNGPQKTVRVNLVEADNRTFTDIPRKMEYRDLKALTQASTVAKEVGASIAAGMRQQVGYGSEMYGISGETELTLNIEASVKAAWENAVTTHAENEITSERNLVERAWHQLIVNRVETVGPARQVIRAKGALKFGIRLHSPNGFVVHWDSMDDFIATLQGIEIKGGHPWLGFHKAHPMQSAALEPFRQTVYAASEKVREFEEASNVKVSITEKPLNDRAALMDALQLLSMKAEMTQLRGLAAAELKRLQSVA